jgi:PAS domain S-box-containing protein
MALLSSFGSFSVVIISCQFSLNFPSAFSDEDGGVLRSVSACRISFRIAAQTSANFVMNTALETESEFAVVLLAQDGTIVDAHPTCHESLGWTREELAGKDIGDLLQSDRELLMTQLMQSRNDEMGVDGQTSFSIRILARRRDETSFPARVVVRRFDLTECCTVAFYRVTPHNDSDTPPIVRPEEIELAMRGNAERPAPQFPPQPKPEKPKSRWRNARLLFGSRPQPETPATPAPEPPKNDVRKASQPIRSVPPLDSRVPNTIFLRKNAPAPETPPATQETQPPVAQGEASVSEAQEVGAPQPPLTAPAGEIVSQSPVTTTDPYNDKLSYEALAAELEQEREERRRLEQRAATLTSQVSALHLQVSENLEIETRNQKKVSTLEEQLRDARNQVTQVKSDLAAERDSSNSAREKIEAATAVSASLTEQIEALQLVHEALARTQAETETQLQAVNNELKQSQEALAAETAKRHELEQSLTRAQQEREEQERKWKLEISKLETALKAKDLESRESQSKAAQAEFQAKA